MTSTTAHTDDSALLKMLKAPVGTVQAVLDTDTYNEIDDQYALAYSVLSPEINLKAIYAAPFQNDRAASPEEGMELSFKEIENLSSLIRKSGFVMNTPAYRGSIEYLPAFDKPVQSDAAKDLIERAMTSSEILYVMAIGAPTNVASSILMEPRIINKIVVVWLGGHPPYWHTAKEFNLQQDLFASRVLLNSGVPLVLMPCKNVAEHLRVTAPELDHYLAGGGPLAEYLQKITIEHMNEEKALSKVVWDIIVPAWLKNAALAPSSIEHSPVLSEDLRWSADSRRHLIRIAYDVDRDGIFKDLYTTLGKK